MIMQFSFDTQVIINGLIITGAQIFFLIILLILVKLSIRLLFRMVATTRHQWIKRMNTDHTRKKAKRIIRIVAIALILFLILTNSYFIFIRKMDLIYTITAFFDRLSMQFWKQAAVIFIKIILAFVLAAYITKLLPKWISTWETKAKSYEQLKANDESFIHFFQSLKRILTNTLWLFVLIFAVKTISLPRVISIYLFILLKIYLIVFIGRLLVDAATVVTDSLYGLSRKYWHKDIYKLNSPKFRTVMPPKARHQPWVFCSLT